MAGKWCFGAIMMALTGLGGARSSGKSGMGAGMDPRSPANRDGDGDPWTPDSDPAGPTRNSPAFESGIGDGDDPRL